jgi:surface polysaccharide O-acyltransferase-like enzyme
MASGERATKAVRSATVGDALEAFRIVATLLVVLFHASLAYLATPLRLTLWLAHDGRHSRLFDLFAYWANGFVMPLFFLAAGFTAPAACGMRGPRDFLVHRARRLLKPLLFASLTVVPLTYILWAYGLVASGQCDLDDVLRWRFPPNVEMHLYGLAHLWFLEYLYIVCMLWCGGWLLASRLTWGDRAREWIFGGAWRPLLLTLPTLAIFLADGDTMLRIDNHLIPNPFRLLHYAYFFAVGGVIGQSRNAKEWFLANGPRFFVLSLGVFALMARPLLRHAAAPLQEPALGFVCVFSAIFAWATLLGVTGLLLRTAAFWQGRLRYLSESSFWVYIVHVPIIGLGQTLLEPIRLPVFLKFAIVATVGLAASLASFELLARYSVLGLAVNGTRKRLKSAGKLRPELAWIVTAGVIVATLGYGVWSLRSSLWGTNFGTAIAGRVYRSGRLSTADLDRSIRRHHLRSIITFTGAADSHPWFREQKKLCADRSVLMRPLALSPDVPPSRDRVLALLATIEASPRPILLQGNRGIQNVALAAALASLLEGQPPAAALRQFDPRYGEFGGPEHSPLATLIYDYERWLALHRRHHTPERFRSWVVERYVASDRSVEDRVAAKPGNPAH